MNYRLLSRLLCNRIPTVSPTVVEGRGESSTICQCSWYAASPPPCHALIYRNRKHMHDRPAISHSNILRIV